MLVLTDSKVGTKQELLPLTGLCYKFLLWVLFVLLDSFKGY